MATVKVTVVKLPIHEDLVEKHIKKDRYPNGFGPCTLWKLGQSFEIADWPGKPDDFPCDWAWSDIMRDVAMVMFDGNPPWMAERGKALTCCTDGFRPVSFLVERIEE